MSEVALATESFSGKPKTVIYTLGTGAGGNISGLLEPALGCIWVVHWAIGFHDDGSARDCQWRLNDQVSASCGVMAGASTAANVYIQLYYAGQIMVPLVLEYGGMRAEFYVVGIAGAKNVQIRAAVTEYRGIPPRI